MLTSIALAYFSTKKQEASLFSQEKKQELPINKETEATKEDKQGAQQPADTNNSSEEQTPMDEGTNPEKSETKN